MNYRAIEAVVRGVVPVVKDHIRENSEPLAKRIDAFEASLSKRMDDLEKQAIVVEALERAFGDTGGHISSLVEKWGDISERVRILEARQPERGEKGDPGEKGDVGDVGARGEKGEKGDVGERGEKGDPGERGMEGIAGPQGPMGDRGEPGERGAPGEIGERGPGGEKGEVGAAGKDADPQEIAVILEPALKQAAADEVAKRFAEIAIPKDGSDGRDGVGITDAMVDIEGRLVLTLSDGTTKMLGRIVGRDGRDGQPGGPQGGPGPVGPPGNDGKSVVDCGTWDREKTYVEGNLVSWDGSGWFCKQETAGEKPGQTDAWRLFVKKGTPGREGRGIKSARIDDDGQLVITYTDDTVQKAGRVKGDTGRPGRDFEPI